MRGHCLNHRNSLNVKTIATIVSHVQIAYQESVETCMLESKKFNFVSLPFSLLLEKLASLLPMTQGYTQYNFPA